MTLLASLGIAIIFGAGCYLLLKHDFIKVVGGIVLISHSANLFIMFARLSRGQEPIYPLEEGASVADPLVQAMTLTAIVISFGISALLIALIYRVYQAHRSVDIGELSDVEGREVQLEEQREPAEEPMPRQEDIDPDLPEVGPSRRRHGDEVMR
jgi:multicomponent Na+:H+ antiporter subunit C